MKLQTILCILLLQIVFKTQAHTVNKEKDIESIRNLCGCFEVDFKYKETLKVTFRTLLFELF